MEWLNGILAWRQMEALRLGSAALKGLASGGKSITTLILILASVLGNVFFDLPMIPSGEELNLDGYEIVLDENFEGSELDLDVWQHRSLGRRRGGYNDSSQVWVEDGKLILQAEYKEDGTYGPGWYAGMLRTREEYLYGYFEITCINNKGGEFWSAFWLQSGGSYNPEISKGGVGGSEIDIFEAFNYNDGRLREDSVRQTVFCSGADGKNGFETTSSNLDRLILGNFYGKNIYKEFNTYGFEWTPEEYIFYINGVETARYTNAEHITQVLEYPIISLEIPDEIDAEPGFTTRMIVDSVKIYQKP